MSVPLVLRTHTVNVSWVSAGFSVDPELSDQDVQACLREASDLLARVAVELHNNVPLGNDQLGVGSEWLESHGLTRNQIRAVRMYGFIDCGFLDDAEDGAEDGGPYVDFGVAGAHGDLRDPRELAEPLARMLHAALDRVLARMNSAYVTGAAVPRTAGPPPGPAAASGARDGTGSAA